MGRRREIPAGDFKARCLALLDEVAETGQEIVVTKRGHPVAKVVPVEAPRSLRGSVVYEGDLITPLDDEWESNVTAARLEWDHRDPADRLIVATANIHHAGIVSKDDRIRSFRPAAAIW